jgi:hypothetical protein
MKSEPNVEEKPSQNKLNADTNAKTEEVSFFFLIFR